jgi:hypothetical protein
MPHSFGYTDQFNIPKESFETGFADGYTFNAAMDWLDELLGNIGATWKGTVPNAPSLPLLNNVDGDARIVLSTHAMYVWNASLLAWVTPFGTTVYAGTFIQPLKPTVLQVPDGWYGFWVNSVTSDLWFVRNYLGVIFGVEMNPL